MAWRITVLGLAAATAVLAAGCGGGSAKAQPIAFTVEHPVEPAFDPVDVRLSALKPGEQVTVTSTATDAKGQTWTGVGHYTADASGTVDLAEQASTGGTYTGADASGLLWSADPPTGSTATGFAVREAGFQVTLTATGPGSATSTTVLTRLVKAPGVTEQPLTLAQNKVIGKLYLPAGTSVAHPRPALLFVGGSEGGESQDATAAILASEGYPALSLAYFGLPGLPGTLANIPLEYFEQAGRDLAAVPGVDPAHVLIDGASRGSEAALQAAQYFPDVFHGAIVVSPSSVTNRSFPDGTTTAWTLHGTPLGINVPIPVDHISGPVLAFAGDDDVVWPSGEAAGNISAELDKAHSQFPHKASIYPHAGHGIDEGSTIPAMTTVRHPVTGEKIVLGGTRQDDAKGQADVWSQVLTLLKSL
jgi:dienelactone hydrolase